MPGTDDETERWQRIRDQQIAARDPSYTREKRYQSAHRRQSSRRKSMTLNDIIRTFSNKIIGFFIGLLLGIVAWIVLSILVDAAWVDWAGLACVVLFAGFGVLVGASFDWRDNLRDF